MKTKKMETIFHETLQEVHQKIYPICKKAKINIIFRADGIIEITKPRRTIKNKPQDKKKLDS